MRKRLELYKNYIRNKRYMLLLILTALCGYGFLITHGTVGIDDTPCTYYFEEGLLAMVGRWVLFLLNKVVHIADFAPFITDFAAVLILMAAVTVWCVLFCEILQERVPGYGYCFFACIFLSCPLLAEVFPYYLHNGVAIGYLACGISLWYFREGMELALPLSGGGAQSGRRSRHAIKRLIPFAGGAAGLWVALGCYESFMVVWLLGVCLVLLTERLAGMKRKCFRALVLAAAAALAAIALRSVTAVALSGLFGLGGMEGEAVQRSITGMMSWMFGPGAAAEFAMALKRVFVMYGAFAYAYYPIKIFVLASGVIVCFCLWRAIRQKDIWIALLMAGSFAVSFSLVVVEGKATLYRSAQFLPVICAVGALLFSYAFQGLKGCLEKSGAQWRGKKFVVKVARILPPLVLSVILWNQCTDLNKWFYVDYLKYEDAKSTASQIAFELERSFDISKPVIFTGTYELPKSILADTYVDYGTETFYKINRWTCLVDEHLLEKFYRPYGVMVAQTPTLSVLDWGRYAFDSDAELARFFAMHGHKIVPCMDISLYAGAEEYSLDLPHFPQEGSIVDMGDYIIVHF